MMLEDGRLKVNRKMLVAGLRLQMEAIKWCEFGMKPGCIGEFHLLLIKG